jgi:hypothetical protein
MNVYMASSIQYFRLILDAHPVRLRGFYLFRLPV